MSLSALTKPWEAFSYGFLDASAKRELRRKMLKAIAVPGCQMPYASREVPIARGWGTGGLQVTLFLGNESIDGGAVRRLQLAVDGNARFDRLPLDGLNILAGGPGQRDGLTISVLPG